MIGVAARGDGPREEFMQALEPFRSGHDANHNYSVWFSYEPSTFHRLQWGGCTVVRTRDRDRFASALALHLSGHGFPSPGLVRTDGVVGVHGGRAIVLPAALRQVIPTYESPLRAGGLILANAPWVDIDLRTAEVVVEPPRLAAARFDAAVARLPASNRSEPVAEPGRYPLAGWYFAPISHEDLPMSRTDALATVLTRLPVPLTDGDQLAAMAELLDRTPFGRKLFRTPRQLLDQIGP